MADKKQDQEQQQEKQLPAKRARRQQNEMGEGTRNGGTVKGGKKGKGGGK